MSIDSETDSQQMTYNETLKEIVQCHTPTCMIN